jgi:hypothetical protein
MQPVPDRRVASSGEIENPQRLSEEFVVTGDTVPAADKLLAVKSCCPPGKRRGRRFRVTPTELPCRLPIRSC